MNRSIYQKLAASNVTLNDVNTIVHAGAGACVEANFYHELSPKHVLLLEADNKQAQRIEKTLHGQNNQITVINKALVANKVSDTVDFYLTQPAQFSGIEEPFTIKKLFKNLKTQNKVRVPSVTLTELVEEFCLNSEQKNILVLQVNGAEKQVLSNVTSEVLSVFDVIVVQVIKPSLGLSARNENNLTAELLALNYELMLTEEHDLIFENQVYILDKQKQLIDRLQQELSNFSAKNDKLLNKNKALDKKIKESKEKLQSELNEKQSFVEHLANQKTALIDLQGKTAELEATVSQQENKIAQLVSRNNEQRDSLKQAYENHNAEKQTLTQNATDKIAQITDKLSKSDASLKSKIALNEKLTTRIAEFESQIPELNARNSELESRITELESLNSELKSELAERTKQRDEQQKWHRTHKERAETANKAISELKTEFAETTRRKDAKLLESYGAVEDLKKQLADKEQQLTKAIETSTSAISGSMLENIVTQITESHKKELAELRKKLDWRMDKGFNNSIKQVESFIGVQNYLETGQLSMEYHGWPISSDVALFLLGKIEANNYDLIIEFGSGTSTKLFAQAMSNRTTKTLVSSNDKKRIGKESHNNMDEVVEYSYDLPQRVLTFEHNKKYYLKTRESLVHAGLDDVVNLVHAPLVDYKCDGGDYLYYDCDKALQHIADIYQGRTAKILVLIDGPPAATGPLARLPAISKLLNTLAAHQLDLVLDDYIRSEEKEIAKVWKKTMEARFINYEEELVPCEKGAWFCRVNP